MNSGCSYGVIAGHSFTEDNGHVQVVSDMAVIPNERSEALCDVIEAYSGAQTGLKTCIVLLCGMDFKSALLDSL